MMISLKTSAIAAFLAITNFVQAGDFHTDFETAKKEAVEAKKPL